MNPGIQLEEKYRHLVVDLLKKHLPSDAMVWVFGSRANRKPKPFSDLDLAIDVGHPLPYSTLLDLKQDFEESELPYKVDLVDRHTLTPSFGERVDDDRAYTLFDHAE